MSKSKARFLADLLSSDGKVIKAKSQASTIVVGDLPTIPNSKLANSSVTIAGEGLSLGASLTLDTGDVTEHTAYKYYTDARARASISATGSLSYNSTTGVMSFTMPAQNTSNITEGSNLYFTNARADARIVNAGSANWNTAYGWGNHASAGYTTTDTTYSVGDGGLSQNNFTNADHSKLNAIEASADVTDTTNVVAALTAGTNITIAANGTIASTDTNTTYSVGDGGLTQNNFTNADHSKLNAIEASATADQTNAEIRTAVEAATDSNVFTDADHSKLGGIAASANNYTLPSGYATETYVGTQISNLVDSSPAALNTLNELAAALGDDPNFATTVSTSIGTKLPLAGGTLTGNLLLDVDNAEINLKSGGGTTSGAVNWTFNTTGTDFASIKLPYATRASIGLHIDSGYPLTLDGTTSVLFAISGNNKATINNSGLTVVNTITASGGNSGQWNTAYGWGNHASAGYTNDQTAAEILTAIKTVDGSGSGLDADLLDGVSSASFLRSDADDSFTGGLASHARDEGIFGQYSSTQIDHIWSMGTAYKVHSSGANFGNLYGLAYKHTNNTTGGTMGGGHQIVWANSGTPRAAIGYDRFWHAASGNLWGSSNDGSGSGLDADLLDGNHASAFATSAQGTLATNALPKAGGTLTGDLTVGGTTQVTASEFRITSSAAHTTHLNYNNTGTNYISQANGGTTYIRNSAGTLFTFGSGGTLNVHSGNFQMGGTTVIDTSRNLTNIGTISSGAIQGSSTIDSTNVTTGTFRVYDGSTFRGGLGTGQWASGSTSQVGNWSLYAVGTLNLHSNNSGVPQVTQTSSGFNSTIPYQINGTTVIDASRNLTNIGTISSGAITAPNIRASSGAFYINRSSDGTQAIRVDADGVVIIPTNYFYVSASQGSYFSSAVRFRGTISNDTGTNVTFGQPISVSGTVAATGGNSTNWNTAYGWGNHASAGYTNNVGDITGVTAGTGLTGGGTSGTPTLNVIGGSGITANANDIAVDSTVIRTTGNQSMSGTKTFTGVIDANGGHGGINITSTSILSAASSTWTGNPGANGKIQYHSNRWYIVADSSSNRIVQFRRDGSDKSYIDNNGTFVGNVSGSSGSSTGNAATATALTAGDKTIAGALIVGNTTHSDIYMVDTDEGNRRIHCNSNRIGFLNSSNAWSCYSTDAGRWECGLGLTVSNGLVNNNAGINYVGTTVTGGTSNMIGFRWIGGANTVNVGVDNAVNIIIGTASDYRLKIVTTNDIGDSLSRLKSLNTYEYTSKDEDTGTVYRGVLAHEVAKLFPNLALGAKDDPNQLQSVNHAAFTIELIQAMKQLDARLTAIEAHLNIEAAELVIPDYEPVASPDFVFPVLPEAVPAEE